MKHQATSEQTSNWACLIPHQQCVPRSRGCVYGSPLVPAARCHYTARTAHCWCPHICGMRPSACMAQSEAAARIRHTAQACRKEHLTLGCHGSDSSKCRANLRTAAAKAHRCSSSSSPSSVARCCWFLEAAFRRKERTGGAQFCWCKAGRAEVLGASPALPRALQIDACMRSDFFNVIYETCVLPVAMQGQRATAGLLQTSKGKRSTLPDPHGFLPL